eukprot:PhF_6_TR32943/c0_g1_i1/m.48455
MNEEIDRIQLDLVQLDRRRTQENIELHNKLEAALAEQERWRRMYEESQARHVSPQRRSLTQPAKAIATTSVTPPSPTLATEIDLIQKQMESLRQQLGSIQHATGAANGVGGTYHNIHHQGGGGAPYSSTTAAALERNVYLQMASLQQALEECRKKHKAEAMAYQSQIEDQLNAEIRVLRAEKEGLESKFQNMVPKAQLQEAMQSNQSLHKENEKLLKTLRELKTAFDAERKHGVESNAKSQEQLHAAEQAQHKLSLLTAEHQTSLRRIDALHQRLTDLQLEHSQATERAAVYEKECKSMKRALEQLRREKEDLKVSVERFSGENLELRSQLSKSQSENTSLRTELKLIEARSKAYSREKENSDVVAVSLFEKLRTKLEETAKEALEAKASCQRAEIDVQKHRLQQHEAERKAIEAEQKLADLSLVRGELHSKDTAIYDLKSALQELQKQVAQKDDDIKRLQVFVNAFKPCMDVARSQHIF